MVDNIHIKKARREIGLPWKEKKVPNSNLDTWSSYHLQKENVATCCLVSLVTVRFGIWFALAPSPTKLNYKQEKCPVDIVFDCLIDPQAQHCCINKNSPIPQCKIEIIDSFIYNYILNLHKRIHVTRAP